MLVDSHAHLDDHRFDEDRTSVLERAQAAGVKAVLTIGNGSGPDDMGCGVALAEQHHWIFTSAGVHPHEASRVEEHHFEMIRSLAAHPRVVGVGETGLDYHYDHSPRDVQRRVFERHLELAVELDLPVIVHTRESDDDMIAALRNCPAARGVLHCFSSGDRLADEALTLGWHLSFSGVVTFPKALSVAEVARRTPGDRLLIETDSPYLAPVPWRGKRNEPAFVQHTCAFLAELRGTSPGQLAALTTANFEKLFKVELS